MVDWKLYIDSPLTVSLNICGGSLDKGSGYGYGNGYGNPIGGGGWVRGDSSWARGDGRSAKIW